MKTHSVKAALWTVVLGMTFVSASWAQPSSPLCIGGGMLSENCPVLVDLTGDGPSADDLTIVPTHRNLNMQNPTCDPSDVYLATPWDCGQYDPDYARYELQSMVAGKWVTGRRTNNYLPQILTADQFDGFGNPRGWTFLETSYINPNHMISGTATLGDTDNNDRFDQFVGAGINTAFSAQTDFVGVDLDNDGNPDYISIPWAQSSALGVVHGDGCPVGLDNGMDPQVWVPVSTVVVISGTQHITGSVIALDLSSGSGGSFACGADGIPDPGFHRTPLLEAAAFQQQERAAVPALSQWGLIALMLGVAALGWVLLRRRLLRV